MWDLVLKLLLKRAQLCHWILIWMLGFETTIFFNCVLEILHQFSLLSISHMHANTLTYSLEKKMDRLYYGAVSN